MGCSNHSEQRSPVRLLQCSIERYTYRFYQRLSRPDTNPAALSILQLCSNRAAT